MKKVLYFMLVLTVCLGAGASAQDVVFNGGFDFPDEPSAAWNLTGVDIMNPGDWSIPINDGQFAGAVRSWSGDWNLPTGTLSQDIYAAPGTYNLTFDYFIGARMVNDPGRTAGLNVNVNGNQVFSESVAPIDGYASDFAWKTAVVPIVVTDGEISLSFDYIAHYAEWTWLGVDNVSMTAVPEPGSVLALLTGLVGFGGMAIRRRK